MKESKAIESERQRNTSLVSGKAEGKLRVPPATATASRRSFSNLTRTGNPPRAEGPEESHFPHPDALRWQ